MLDSDLATLYDVKTKVLVKALKRNMLRFPADFMFQLTSEESSNLRFQIGTSSWRQSWGGRRYPPYAFTEHGVTMLSSILRSRKAILVNIEIVRTFVRLRQVLASDADFAHKLNDLEKKCDYRFGLVLKEIGKLIRPAPDAPTPKIRLAKEIPKSD